MPATTSDRTPKDIIFMILSLVFAKDIIYFLIKDNELANLSYRFAYVFILTLPIISPFFALDNYLRLCGKANMSMWITSRRLFSPCGKSIKKRGKIILNSC